MSDLTLTARQLMESVPGLQSIGGKTISNIKAAYALAKIKRAVSVELTDLEAMRIQLCESHAKQTKDGPAKTVDGKYELRDNEAFGAEWDVLLQESVTLVGCRAIRLSELEGAALTADELFQLGPMVVEDGEPASNGGPQLVPPEPAVRKT